MLLGTHTAERTLRLVYNPDPLGNVNALNEQAAGENPDLGAYDIRVFSDVVSLYTCPYARTAKWK
jgi:hypothetical protein